MVLILLLCNSVFAAPMLGIYNTQDVTILHVSPGSPAEKYGLKNGDRVIRVNDEIITSNKKFGEIMNTIPGYTMFSLTVLRSGREIVLQMQKEEFNMKPYDPTKQIINVPEGSFSFDNLNVFTPSYGGNPWLAGRITNNTDKEWSNLRFNVKFYDIENNPLGDTMLTIYSLGIGKQYQFGDKNYGETIYNMPKGKLGRLELSYFSGIYPVIYNCSMIKPEIGNTLLYSDENLSIQYRIVSDSITFQLTNKTNNPIKVDWNQISFIDSTGLAQRIMHTGVKYNNANEYQQPSIVPPLAKIEDQLIPTKNIWFEKGEYGGWRTNPLFPEGPIAEKLVGSTFGVFFPLEINGQIVNYNFTFRIESITK